MVFNTTVGESNISKKVIRKRTLPLSMSDVLKE